MADPNLRQLTRHVLENTNADDWWWDRISAAVGNEEFHSPSVCVAGRHVSVKIEVECPRWLVFLFPIVKVEVDGLAARPGGSYTAVPWSTESRFLWHQYRKVHHRSMERRRAMVAEINRGA